MSELRSRRGVPAIAVIAAFAAIMLPVPSAAAAPAAIDQYVPNVNPTGEGPIPGVHQPAADTGTGGAGTAKETKKGTPEEGTVEVSASDLPGSDFPTVPLVTVALIALGLGLAIWVLRGTSTREAQ